MKKRDYILTYSGRMVSASQDSGGIGTMGNSAERAREIINEIRADAKSDEGPVLFDRDHFMLPGYVIRELLRGYDIAMAAQQGVVNLLTALDKARDERDEAQDALAACTDQDNESYVDESEFWIPGVDDGKQWGSDG